MFCERFRTVFPLLLLAFGTLLGGCSQLEKSPNPSPQVESAFGIPGSQIFPEGSAEAKALSLQSLNRVGESITLSGADGVKVKITLTKIDVKQGHFKTPPETVQPQAIMPFILTYVFGRSLYGGVPTYVTGLTNYSKVTASVSKSITRSASGSTSGGLSSYYISLNIGFDFGIIRTYTVTANNVRPGQTVRIYMYPTGYYYAGQQRRAAFGVSGWFFCKPTTCSAPVSWSAIRLTGFSWILR